MRFLPQRSTHDCSGQGAERALRRVLVPLVAVAVGILAAAVVFAPTPMLIGLASGAVSMTMLGMVALVQLNRAFATTHARFHGVFNDVSTGIAIVTRQGVCICANDRLGEILGCRSSELEGRQLAEVAGTDIPLTSRRTARETRLVLRDGTRLVVDLNVVRSTRRGPWGEEYIVSVFDLTGHKEVEARLRESRRTLQALLSNLPGFAYRCRNDPHWTMEFVSEGVFDLTGYTSDQIRTTRPYGSIIHPADRERLWQEVQASLGRGEPFRTVYRILTADGDEKWVWEQGRAVHGEGGEVEALEGFITDITAFRRAEEERDRLLEEQRRAVAVRDEFLSVASHELKTPLTSLTLGIQQLSREFDRGADAEKLRRWAEMTQRQSGRLSVLVNQLLDVSRLEHGGLVLHREQFDLSELLRDLVERMKPEADRFETLLKLQAEEAVWGSWDRSRLEQVLGNLISNAIKYGARRPVDISVSGYEQTAQIRIADRGIGISDADRERIFGRFERAVSVRHYGGLGLGLYIVRNIVEAHGGAVTVQSKAGHGSVFVVELPRESLDAHAQVQRRFGQLPEEQRDRV